MEFVYALHYRLLLNQIGIWLFGIAALIWTADCFVGFFLTLPARSSRNRPPARRRSWPSRWGGLACSMAGLPVSSSFRSASRVWALGLASASCLCAIGGQLQSQTRSLRTVYEDRVRLRECRRRHSPLSAPRDQPIMVWRDAHAAARTLMEQAALQHGFRIIRENMLSYDPDRGTFSYRVFSRCRGSRAQSSQRAECGANVHDLDKDNTYGGSRRFVDAGSGKCVRLVRGRDLADGCRHLCQKASGD